MASNKNNSRRQRQIDKQREEEKRRQEENREKQTSFKLKISNKKLNKYAREGIAFVVAVGINVCVINNIASNDTPLINIIGQQNNYGPQTEANESINCNIRIHLGADKGYADYTIKEYFTSSSFEVSKDKDNVGVYLANDDKTIIVEDGSCNVYMIRDRNLYNNILAFNHSNSKNSIDLSELPNNEKALFLGDDAWIEDKNSIAVNEHSKEEQPMEIDDEKEEEVVR